MGYAHEYADAVLHRGRVPMEPAGFVPDWPDAPRKGRFFPGAETYALPDGAGTADAPAAPGLLGAPRPGGAGGFTLPLLAAMLRDTYALTGRRLGVQANSDLPGLPLYPHANWSRGTAGGGGLYPVAVHWASGASGPLVPGVHHYDPARHAVQRLLTGDVTARVREALGPDAPAEARRADHYLLLSVKYWQTAFKYNSFGFHVVCTDVGTLLRSWRFWAAGHGLRVDPVFWFDEPRLDRLLGTRDEEESVFAVVPLRWAGADGAAARGTTAGPDPAVRHRDLERSRTVLSFPAVRAMRAATLAGATERPAPGTPAAAAVRPLPAGGTRVALPAPAFPEVPVRRVLRDRRSSFGRFDAARRVTPAELSAVLAACAATSLGGEAGTGPGGAGLVRTYAFVNHVEGIGPGAYAYDAGTGELVLVVPGAQDDFLQENYFLANYNLEQAGAVLVPTVRTTGVLDAVGGRGYRIAVGTAGAVAQSCYLAASALSLGAGVALGFDNVSFVERLGLSGTGEAPLLIMPIGHERPAPADFRHEIA
ncbi:nitroreductase family protein [Streptomyces omiyaensis]|uniref:Nitroreductase family protein n=1 Tax=Streptomyces omiyaensis TaxID=68247 RepID=A0ABW7BQW6_9ACTN|nr:nitroreductase family protein [Streptomyces omiyaensis]GGY59533.1 NADH oxidase [Streptomyces omiyaensis]